MNDQEKEETFKTDFTFNFHNASLAFILPHKLTHTFCSPRPVHLLKLVMLALVL